MMSVPKEDVSGLHPTPSFMEICDTESYAVLQKIREFIEEFMFCQLSEVEDKLKNVMSMVVKTVQQMYIKNNSIAQSSEDGVLDMLRANFQVALNLTDYSHNILQHLMKNQSLPLKYIPSIPVDMAQILCLTFDHCKNSQKTYRCYYKSVSEILHLFKKTQELHRKYLIFIDAHLVIDFLNENDIKTYDKILEMVVKISGTLSGVNLQSTVENWKAFLALVHKSSVRKVVSGNLALAVQFLSEEIDSCILSTIEMESEDPTKCNQNFKVTSFLVKVVLKLFELDLDFSDIYEDILKFWTMIYRWNDGFVRTNKYPDGIVDPMHMIFQFCSGSVPNFVSRNSGFLKFCIMSPNCPVSNQSFGFLMFINALIKEIPEICQNEPEFQVVTALELVFRLTKMCYKDYFCDYNSEFYEELVTNVSMVVLHFPNQFPNVEFLLLESVVKDDIWTALLAVDIWCLLLRHSQENVCRSTLNALIKKIDDLKLGLFHQTPAAVRLKILTQRIFKTLSSSIKTEVMSKYNPTTHLSVWKILSLRHIPLCHRYYVEFLMCDILDVKERNICSSSEMLHLLESVDIISYTKFKDLEMFASRLVPFIMQLWSFDIRGISLNNKIFKYFIYKLIKLTTTVSGELTGENLILVLNQLKILGNDVLFELLICDLLQTVAKENLKNFPGKATLFMLILSLLQSLLADKNSIVVELALESFFKIADSNNYNTLVLKVSNSSDTRKTIADYVQRKAAEDKYNSKYFDKLHSFTYHHRCYNWISECEPACKKIKIDDDSSLGITKLKEDAEKLINGIDKNDLSNRQKSDIKYIIRKLETLLN